MYNDDICPIMSIGKKEPALCTEKCAWFDTKEEECAISRINGNTKWLQSETHVSKSIDTDK